jgi:hypothetical protein
MRNLIIISIVFILSGCGTARTLVLEPVTTNNKYTNVTLIADNPNVEVPADVTDKIESVIKKGLYEKGPFSIGNDLEIHYTFISHDPGNQFARWFWGGIGNAGEGSVAVTVRYIDKSNKEIAKTQVEGRIGSGFFGGSISEAITKAGEDIVEFTINQFAAGE